MASQVLLFRSVKVLGDKHTERGEPASMRGYVELPVMNKRLSVVLILSFLLVFCALFNRNEYLPMSPVFNPSTFPNLLRTTFSSQRRVSTTVL